MTDKSEYTDPISESQEPVHRDRMGGDPSTGYSWVVERILEGRSAFGGPCLLVARHEQTGGVTIGNEDGYLLTAPELVELFNMAIHTAEACGDEEILQYNRAVSAAERRREAESLAKYRAKSKAKREPRRGYVYLLEGGGYHKIGKSTNPSKRIETLEIQLPYPVQLIHTIESSDHDQAEIYMQELFAHKRTNGEWFKLSQDDLDEICNIESLFMEAL